MSFSKHVPLLAGVFIVLYRIVRRPTAGERVGGVLGLAAGLAPAVWLVAAHGVPAKIVVGYAVLFFVGSVLLKMAIYLGVMTPHVLPRSSPLVGGSLQGLLSASCELGAAAVAFGLVFPGLDFPAVLGFGAGAAALEAVIVSVIDAESVHAGGPNAKLVETQIAAMRKGPVWVSVMSVFADRAVATTLHIACRGLVGVGIATARAWPTVVAFALFASVDGFAMYCLRSGWEYGHASVALRLYGTLAALSAASVAGLVIAT
jgi:multisubunit Na+/H+ antiporter MnhF subunit